MKQLVEKLSRLFLQVWVLFILVEVLWMLLPFAGFLYGSVFHMRTLNRSPQTAWLAHFVFPVHTAFPLGIVLMVSGLVVFAIGATHIYTAKFRRSGLVSTGIYRKIRHPQYLALILFGVGTLLTWGRFITFLAFFAMMFLYYRLALSEERNCEKLFGKAYEKYRTRTYFLFPGEKWLARIWKGVPNSGLPGWITVPLHFILILVLAYGLGNLIQAVKVRLQTVPFVAAEIDSLPEMTDVSIPFVESRDGRIVLIQGPFGPAQERDYANRLLEMIETSPVLREAMDFLNTPGPDLAFILPGAPGGMPDMPLDEKSRVQLFIVRIRSIDPTFKTAQILKHPAEAELHSAMIVTFDPTMPETNDPVIDLKPHPGGGIIPRWMGMLEAVRQRTPALSGDLTKGPPKLILVQAPIVRARDKAFAEEIMDRLLRSELLRGMLARYEVGGNVLAVAFPRPGPNWYREHHGAPQIGAFVMLVIKREGVSDKEIFRHDMKDRRKLEAAFIVEMDFAIPPPKDPVYQEPFIVGPMRDLEERWDFFLSGVK